MKLIRDYYSERAEKKRFDWDVIKKLMRFLRPHRSLLVLSLILLLFAKAVEVSIPLFLGKITDYMLDSTQQGERVLAYIISGCSWVFGLLLIGYFFDGVNVFIKSWIGQNAIYDIRNRVYNRIIHLPLNFYNQSSVGRLITRTIHDVDQLNMMFSEGIVPIIGSLFLFTGIFSCVIFLDWRVALVAAVLFPIAFLHTNYFRINQRRCYEAIRSIVSAMNGFVQENLMGALTIRRFGLHEREKRHFDEMNQDHATAYKETISYFAFFYAGIDLLQSLSLIAVFAVLVAFAPASQGFDAGTYFTFSLYALMLFRPLADLAERYNELQSAVASAGRIFDVLERREEPKGGKLKLKEIETVAFDDVWFAYKDENWVIRGLSFSLNKGQSMALVGPTGSGKTSIQSLIMRFYEPQRGTILINGRSIKDYSTESLRSQFSVVLQDPVIFSGTLEENLSLGDPKVAVDEVILKLNMQHLRSHLTERGRSLSAGEMQLIAMARALAHRRNFFMLDEATANIDTATEKLIQDVVKQLMSQSTSLIIAHRLSTVKHVDQIVVLSEGKLVEQGTHQQLMKMEGMYEKLYRLQFMD